MLLPSQTIHDVCIHSATVLADRGCSIGMAAGTILVSLVEGKITCTVDVATSKVKSCRVNFTKKPRPATRVPPLHVADMIGLNKPSQRRDVPGSSRCE